MRTSATRLGTSPTGRLRIGIVTTLLQVLGQTDFVRKFSIPKSASKTPTNCALIRNAPTQTLGILSYKIASRSRTAKVHRRCLSSSSPALRLQKTPIGALRGASLGGNCKIFLTAVARKVLSRAC